MKKKKIIEDDQFIYEDTVIKLNDDANDPLNIKNIDDTKDEKKFTWTKDQKCFLDAVKNCLNSGEQMLLFAHGAAGAGKSTVMNEVTRLFKAKGKRVVVVCPTGIASTLIEGATTLHHAFKLNYRGLNEEKIIELLQKETFQKKADLLLYDEISMN